MKNIIGMFRFFFIGVPLFIIIYLGAIAWMDAKYYIKKFK